MSRHLLVGTSYPQKKECDPFGCDGKGEEEDPQVWDRNSHMFGPG
jgi:hypothetical protein